MKVLYYKKCNFIIVIAWQLEFYKLGTVGENIITTTKIRNNYGAIQSFIFPTIAIAIVVAFLRS